MLHSAKPYVRWWWFSGEIRLEDLRAQLDWVKANHFGGVEIAWLYPQPGSPVGPALLSPGWSKLVLAAAEYARHLGLGCDFTMGSAWPFGGFHVSETDASRTFEGISPQRLEKSWDVPLGVDGGYILNHLDRTALLRYGRAFGAALELPTRADTLGTPGLFCDSWEVLPEGLWSAEFQSTFVARFGYDVLPLMSELDRHPHERFDYRCLLAELALNEFYGPYTKLCHELGGIARVQCHGAPVDLLAAYALADVPETEAILFDPDFATFAASAAALSGKRVVSAEAFTCMYGWLPCPGPAPFQQQECLADLKLVADALMANGVNHMVWHGMPANPIGGSNRFYATTHVGPESPFAEELPEFNRYMEAVCDRMREGVPYTDVAVYLPLEDVWMENELPAELQKPSSKYVYELQETKLPVQLKGYHPLWVSSPFLVSAQYSKGVLQCGPAQFRWLFVDTEWLRLDSLHQLLRLGRQGLPICLARSPKEPGRNRHASYNQTLAELLALPNVHCDWRLSAPQPPLVSGEHLPDFWCTHLEGIYHIFFAHPLARSIRYPMRHGHALDPSMHRRELQIQIGASQFPVPLEFRPHESILLRISPSGVQNVTPPAPAC